MGAAASALRHRGRLQLDAGSVKAPFSRQKSRKIATVTKAPAKKSPAARNVVTHLLIFLIGGGAARLAETRPLTEERVVRPPPCVRDPTHLSLMPGMVPGSQAGCSSKLYSFRWSLHSGLCCPTHSDYIVTASCYESSTRSCTVHTLHSNSVRASRSMPRTRCHMSVRS